MNLFKTEYESLLALLNRVEVKGVQEAQALLALAHKLNQKITNWVEPTPPAPAPAEAAPAPEVKA